MDAANAIATAAAACGRPINDPYSYKTMTSLSQNNFSVLAKIVKSLKQRYLDGDSEPLTLEEIFDETNQHEISSRQRNWLENEALEQNIRVNVIRPDQGQTGPIKYQFKPLLNIKDRKSLRRYLEKQYQNGQGGVLLDDILESMPNANEAVKYLVKHELVVTVQRTVDKKKLVFYNEGKKDIKIDEEFLKLWRSVSVEGIAEDKIEEYLAKHGIKSIQDLASRKLEPVQKRRKVSRKQNKNFKSHNEHMKDILEDYTV